MNGLQRFRAMGCEVVVGGADERELRAIVALFERREATFSRFRVASEINRVNAAPAGSLLVSPEFAGALEVALAAVGETGGLVDPTLHDALVNAGYDRDFADLRDDPRTAGPPVPGRSAQVRLVGRLLTRPPGLRLDLNGVVKAMTADAALELIGGDGFVSAGGDVATRGGLDVGLPGGGSVRLESGALATSGSASRSWIRGGSRRHHLIDPRTGRPARSPWEQVTACGATCVAADVAAKTAFLLGDDGPDWLDARGFPGRFVGAAGETLVNTAWRMGVERSLACI